MIVTRPGSGTLAAARGPAAQDTPPHADDGSPAASGPDHGSPAAREAGEAPAGPGADGPPVARGADGSPTAPGTDGSPAARGADRSPTAPGTDGSPAARGLAAKDGLLTAIAGLRERRGAAATRGLAPGLLVPDGAPGWVAASALTAGGLPLDDLLAAPARRWGASPHAAAALAWRAYTYWLAIPAALGWATARRVPLLDPEDVRVRPDHRPAAPGSTALVTIGLRRVRLAVLPEDPLACGGDPDLTVVGSETELLAVLRSTMRDGHLDPLLARIQDRVHLGTRPLLGSLASAVAYAVVRGIEAPPATLTSAAETLLAALGVADLVTFDSNGAGPPAVQRRTCCLAFTLPEPKICSGCCLRRPSAI